MENGRSKEENVRAGARSEGLRRGLEILGLYSDVRCEWGITEISREMNLHKSRVHRAVKTLEDVGFLRKDPKSQKYSLGIRAYDLGIVAARHFSLTPEARPLMQEVADETKAAISIRVRDGSEIVIIESIESSGVLRVHSPPGARRPWDFGAGGKLFAAYLSTSEVKMMIENHGLGRYTEKSITKEDDFFKELEIVRGNGYAVSEGEHIPGVISVAAPILNLRGEMMAAFLASLPSTGLSEEQRSKIISTVIMNTAAISDLLKKEAGIALAG